MKNKININIDKTFDTRLRKNFNVSNIAALHNISNNNDSSINETDEIDESDDVDNTDDTDDIDDVDDIRDIDDLIKMLVERNIDIDTIDVVKVSKIFDQFHAGLISPVEACDLIQVSIKKAVKTTKENNKKEK